MLLLVNPLHRGGVVMDRDGSLMECRLALVDVGTLGRVGRPRVFARALGALASVEGSPFSGLAAIASALPYTARGSILAHEFSVPLRRRLRARLHRLMGRRRIAGAPSPCFG